MTNHEKVSTKRNRMERMRPPSVPKKAADPLSDDQLTDVAGGRITNVRVNANGITGGGPIPANALS